MLEYNKISFVFSHKFIWYLNKSKEIAPIENRYVNESGTQTQIEECKDEVYQKEIIKRIGC